MTVAAVAAAGLTGCADRPNDLDTYYDDPADETTQETAEGGAPPATESTTATRPSPAADTAVLDEAVRSAVLTGADVASEGVQPAASVQGTSGCLARVPIGLVAPSTQQARWEYPTGSVLEQLVTGYTDRQAAEVLNGRVRCAGDPLTLPVEPAVDAQEAWCEDGTCTVLLAGGNVVSAVQVAAGDRQRAAEAVRRLAPIAATKLVAS